MTKTNYEIETSLTLDYRMSAWGIERIVLDSISNHLPEDSKGTDTSVRLKQDGQFVDLKDADRSKPTEEVVFEDNGLGYDAGLLSVLFSPKATDALSVGQFGEGLKMASAAALRNGLNIEYKSRNWRASPYTKPETIDGHRINRLCFKVTENGDHLEGSRTVFSNPSDDLMAEIFQLPNKVLALNGQYTELHNERNNIDYSRLKLKNIDYIKTLGLSRIIDLGTDSTSLFIKGVRVQGSNALFSYDLGLNDISPDRVFANREKVLDGIESLLKGCSNTAVIERVLREAQQNPERYCDEFEAFRDRTLVDRKRIDRIYDIPYFELPYTEKGIGFEVGNHDELFKNDELFKKYLGEVPENLWVRTFRNLFGTDAVIASQNTNTNSDAQIFGYKPVRLNNNVSKYLLANGILSADTIENNKQYKWVDIGELTESEREMIGRVTEINQIVLGEPRDVDVRVYSGLFSKSGREVTNSGGVCQIIPGGSGYIGIKRSLLGTLEDFAGIYIHELGHLVTGALDADRRFTEFFVKALSKLSIYYMKQGK